MSTFTRVNALMGLMLLLACAKHHAADGLQQAGILTFNDTTGTDLEAEQANAFLLANPGVIVLDVRTPDEYRQGHIGGASNLNIYDSYFTKTLSYLDRSKTYVVHCAAGLANGRSRKALAQMDSLGFRKVHHLNGGFSSWQKQGLPVKK